MEKDRKHKKRKTDHVGVEEKGDEIQQQSTEHLKEKILKYIDSLKEIDEEAESERFQKTLRKLRKHFQKCYGYNKYLIQKFVELFPPSELFQLLKTNEKERPVTIRVNTLKTTSSVLISKLSSKGVKLEPVGKWSQTGLIIQESKVPIGATPECLAGHYILQGQASYIPVLALAPEPGEMVLDLCAAPGGKTTHIAALMKNLGTIVANEVNAERVTAILSNLHRLGVQNSIVYCSDGRDFPKVMKGFDRVLLDAPCSGTGVITKHAEVKTKRSPEDIEQKTELQKELILSAIDCLDADSKTGGILVYSTCSMLVEENEAVVDYALQKRNVKLLPLNFEIGKDGFTRFQDHKFHVSLRHTKRFYPHIHSMDGFFVSKFKKFSNNIPIDVL